MLEKCNDAAHLDAWPPMASTKMHPIVAWFFQGMALRLADKLFVHRKVAATTLIFAATGLIFPGRTFSEVSEMIRDLGEPTLDGENKNESIHMLGATAVDQWLAKNLAGEPPSHQILQLVEILEQFAKPEVRNPGGIADEASRFKLRPRKHE